MSFHAATDFLEDALQFSFNFNFRRLPASSCLRIQVAKRDEEEAAERRRRAAQAAAVASNTPGTPQHRAKWGK
jgi:hypothetical protein